MSWIPDFLRKFQNTQSIVICKLGVIILLNPPKLTENMYIDKDYPCLCPPKEKTCDLWLEM